MIIESFAKNIDWACYPKVLHQGETTTWTLTPENACWLLALAYVRDISQSLTWQRLKNSQRPVARERLKFLNNYFERFEKERPKDTPPIEISRLSFTEWKYSDDTVLRTQHVVIHTGKMEERPGAIVDFANKQVHIGAIIPSMTQEEVLFSTASECFIALLCCPKELLDDEVVIMKNIWQHATYSGYLDTCKFTGSCSEIVDVIVMDAVTENQYYAFERDLKKAYMGFANVDSDSITTGKWGCGVFGGDYCLKFVQQVMAAQMAGKKLYYSSFTNDREFEHYAQLMLCIDAKKPTFGWLWQVLQNFKGQRCYNYLMEQLDTL